MIVLGLLPGGVVTPRSPFERSGWRRLADDLWPALRARLGGFWRGPYRNFVLFVLAAALAVWLAFSLRRIDPVEGQVVHEDGVPAAGCEVRAAWYLSRLRGFENALRPLTFRWGEPNDVLADERVLRAAAVKTDVQGRFRFPGSWALGWPGAKGPFVNVRLVAADPLSGRPLAVSRFRAGDGREVSGALDTALAAGREPAALLARLELPAPRIRDVAVLGERIVTAEGTAGVRLYRLAPGEAAPELAGHRPGSAGTLAAAAGSFAGWPATITTAGLEWYDPATPDLAVRGLLRGAFERVLGEVEGRIALASGDAVLLVAVAEPDRPGERIGLGDPRLEAPRAGAELLRLDGTILSYLHSEGTLRLINLASPYRTPATLVDRRGPIAGFDLDAERRHVLVASPGGVTAFGVGRPESIERLGDLELDLRPFAVRGRAVLGARGIAAIRLGGGPPALERMIAIELAEVEAASAWGDAGRLFVPRLGEVRSRTEEREVRFDPLRGSSEVRRLVLRDRVALESLRRVELATGEVVEMPCPGRPEVRLREDALNRTLVMSLLPDGRPLFAAASGKLLVDPCPGAVVTPPAAAR